ncbi:MAG: glycosyltransferase family 2 protein [Rikenellaceae bacterium]
MSSRVDISVVVPLYNEEESLPELTSWVDKVAAAHSLSYELIFIDDGSSDSSWGVIEQLSEKYPAIRAINFARNYGKSAALFCGFAAAEGQVVITMDADLQDSPDEIPELRRMILEEGYDVVSGWKQKRHDPLGKRLPSKFFNMTARLFSGIKLNDFNCGLKAYRRKVIKAIEVYGEMHRYIPILAKNAGFKRIGEKVVEHHPRKYGESKFGIERMVKGYLDLITVTFMSHFGRSPMYFFGGLGTIMFFVGGFTTVWVIIDKLYKQANSLPLRAVTDQPLFYISILCIVLGVQLFLAGFIGELINRNSSDRNRYLIDKTIK